MDKEFSKSLKAFNCYDQTNLSWMQRAQICAELLTDITNAIPGNMSIADIGCGDQKLHGILKVLNLGISYTGYDLLPQSPDIIPLDITREPLPYPYDVAVMLGVISYLENFPEVLSRLVKQVKYLVISHVIRQGNTYTHERISELGWCNHWSQQELEAILNNCGLEILQSRMTPDGKNFIAVCQV